MRQNHYVFVSVCGDFPILVLLPMRHWLPASLAVDTHVLLTCKQTLYFQFQRRVGFHMSGHMVCSRRWNTVLFAHLCCTCSVRRLQSNNRLVKNKRTNHRCLNMYYQIIPCTRNSHKGGVFPPFLRLKLAFISKKWSEVLAILFTAKFLPCKWTI